MIHILFHSNIYYKVKEGSSIQNIFPALARMWQTVSRHFVIMSQLRKNELTEAWNTQCQNELVSRFGRQAINSTCSWNAPHQQIRKLWLLQTQWIPLFLGIRIPEPFLSTLKNMGVKFCMLQKHFIREKFYL